MKKRFWGKKIIANFFFVRIFFCIFHFCLYQLFKNVWAFHVSYCSKESIYLRKIVWIWSIFGTFLQQFCNIFGKIILRSRALFVFSSHTVTVVTVFKSGPLMLNYRRRFNIFTVFLESFYSHLTLELVATVWFPLGSTYIDERNPKAL